ncbi:MAG: protein translocase subunit SecF [Thermomicrobiales bacterium]
MEHLASRRHLWFAISLILIVPGVLSLIFFGLKQGIDFTGGTLWELQFDHKITTEEVRTILDENGFDGSSVQISSDGGTDNVALIRLREIQEASPEKLALKAEFDEKIGPSTELDFSTVGGSVGKSIRNRSVLAVGIASIAILIYMGFAFRNTQNPALYGLCAIAAMLHDVLLVLGVFSILGEFFDVEIDALFVTAMLTIIGFSVHDTIVVFDRIRENLARHVAPTFEGVVDYSLAQTFVRSLNTSMTVVFTLLALYLFGGTSTKNSVLALLIGVVSGTFSSIFNASQLLVAWEHGEIQGLFRRITGFWRRPAAATQR